MSNEAKIWAMVLKCYKCGHRFDVPSVPMEHVLVMPQVCPCPHCQAKPEFVIAPSDERVLLTHQLIDLKQRGH